MSPDSIFGGPGSWFALQQEESVPAPVVDCVLCTVYTGNVKASAELETLFLGVSPCSDIVVLHGTPETGSTPRRLTQRKPEARLRSAREGNRLEFSASLHYYRTVYDVLARLSGSLCTLGPKVLKTHAWGHICSHGGPVESIECQIFPASRRTRTDQHTSKSTERD